MAGTEKIQDVVASVMKGVFSESEEICGIWKQSADPEDREHSEAVGFREGKLTVLVDNSASLQNLVLKREKLLEKINSVSEKKVSEIRFRIGCPD